MSAQSAQRLITMSASGQAGAHLCDRTPFAAPSRTNGARSGMQNPGRGGRGFNAHFGHTNARTIGRSEAVEDLVGPEPLEAMQRLVQGRKLLGVDAAELLDGAHMLLIERIHDGTNFTPLVGQFDANRAAIHTRTLMIQ